MHIDLKKRRKELGLTQADIALGVGVSEATVSRWESGDIHNMRRNRVVKLAELLRVSPMDIIDFADATLGGVKIDHLAHVSAGYGGMADEDILEQVEVPLFCLKGYPAKEVKMLTVKGESMYPRFIEGDRVLFHLQTSVDSGDIGIFQYGDDEVTMKRIIYTPTEVQLVPINPEYPIKTIKGPDLMSCHVIGKVIYTLREE